MGYICMCDNAAAHGNNKLRMDMYDGESTHVNAESRENKCLYCRQTLGPLGGIPCMQSVRNGVIEKFWAEWPNSHIWGPTKHQPRLQGKV